MSASNGLRTLNLCGAGHSGSTLLGLVLGSHRRCFYIGEGAKVRYLGDESRPERKRVCKLCGPGCAVWSRFEWDRTRPLYAQIAAHVGRDVLVDSTKNPKWIRARVEETRAAGGRPHLVLLLRDGRAVINSRLRKYPDRDAEQQIRDWMAQIERGRELFEQFEGPRLELRYETFATRPEQACRRLCELLQIEFESSMLRFQSYDHHPLGGNNGTQYQVARSRHEDPGDAFVSLGDRSREYYEEHEDAIRLDLRWQEEMQPQHLALFEQVAGRFNEPLAWEG